MVHPGLILMNICMVIMKPRRQKAEATKVIKDNNVGKSEDQLQLL